MTTRRGWAAVLGLSVGIGFATQGLAQSPTAVPSFTDAQASAGQAAYMQNCARCHGAQLDDGQFGPPLRGVSFSGHWAGRSIADLFGFVRQSMPPGAAGTLADGTYAQLVAYVLSQNGVSAGSTALPSDPDALLAMRFPGNPSVARGPGGSLAASATLPPWPAAANPLDHFSPVTESMLQDPAPQDWLTWRRDYADTGFSPLTQISRDNVKGLQVAWSLSLPAGANETTPLEHDGVLFVHGPSDLVLALNAATGEQLWQYRRSLPPGGFPASIRNMALYGDKLYFGTSDGHIVALYASSGRVAWDQAITDSPLSRISGGPLVAQGKVMEGVSGRAPGGAYIVGLDAQTGQRAWIFHTIAQPGDPNERTWNDTPLAKRNGGSVWTAGSYDPGLKLAFFGVGNTYDTLPLLHRVKKRGVNNDGLYLESTVALNPDSGRLVWYHQYLPDDQWDYDYAFERQIVSLMINGQRRKLVVTSGKISIYEAVDAATGKYEFSYDMGLQNFITAINPKTGAKTIDPSKYPDHGQTFTICPHSGGGKEWLPGSYNPQTQTVYVPLTESCMVLAPVPKGAHAALSSGYMWSLIPRSDSDGRYGRVEAVNLQARQASWKERQRAPYTTGVLDTGGGVVFAGALDRSFAAYDDANGQLLWKTVLSDVPSAAPITYMVNGRQYVAMIVGFGGPQTSTFPVFVPEIKFPPAPSSSVWVFELPH